MQSKRTTLLVLVLTIFIGGCATVFTPSSDTITITSDPEGAEVYLDGELIGTTPVTFEADRDVFKHKYVTINKAGYEPKEIQLKKNLNTASLFNLTSGLSWTTDAISGAMFEYNPKSYMIILNRKGEAAAFRSEERLRRQRMAFVALHYNDLRREIAGGGGMYLASLCDEMVLMETTPEAFATRIQQNRLQLLESETPVQLMHQIAALAD